MRAMILAAGRGNRLRPLTDTCPKPLIKVAGTPLIVYHLENLKKAGITDIVINLAHLGEKIEAFLGNGSQWGVHIAYSKEEQALETGGGIFQALPLLGSQAFMIVNGDIWTDYPFHQLPQNIDALGHVVLVNNPPHHVKGDYGINSNNEICLESNTKKYTYSGICVLQPALFANCQAGVAFRLPSLFENAITANRLKGEVYQGAWTDVGTLERLQALEKTLVY